MAAAYTPQAQQFYSMMAAQQRQKVPHPLATKTPPLHIPSAAEAGFAQQRQSANEQYRTQIVGNDYERANTASNYSNQFRDLVEGFSKQREQLPFNYLRRGILGSGIYHQGLQDYAQQRLRATGDLNTQKSQQLGAFDLVRQNIESQRATALAQIEAQRQQLMGQLAPGSIA